MSKKHIVVDLAKCVGCYNCMIACKDEHVGNAWLPYTDAQQKHSQKWISPEKHERGAAPFTEVSFVTKLCQHCGDAPCEKRNPRAIRRRADGIVLIDPDEAKANEALVDACPYGMISWNEELGTAQKCTMCAHLLDAGWREPRCVQACPLRALSIVTCEDAEFDALADAQVLKPLYDGTNKPRVLYKNLYKKAACFIAGALAYRDNGHERAAGGATVRLIVGGEVLKEVQTDFFGEFKIDHLPKNCGSVDIEAVMPGFKPIRQEVTVGETSPCLSVMVFEE